MEMRITSAPYLFIVNGHLDHRMAICAILLMTEFMSEIVCTVLNHEPILIIAIVQLVDTEFIIKHGMGSKVIRTIVYVNCDVDN